jgi:hypothetical protein
MKETAAMGKKDINLAKQQTAPQSSQEMFFDNIERILKERPELTEEVEAILARDLVRTSERPGEKEVARAYILPGDLHSKVEDVLIMGSGHAGGIA